MTGRGHIRRFKILWSNILFISIIIIAIAVSYHSNIDRSVIVQKIWKYQSGYPVGDMLSFDNVVYTIDDSLYISKYNSKIAKVVSANNQLLIITSLKTNEQGKYIFFSPLVSE